MSQGKTLGTSGARLADYLSASLLARVFPASGSDLLWRCAKNRQLPVHKALSDGSYLSALAATRRSPAGVSRTIKDAAQGVVVRVIEYSLPGSEERYRLITSLLDEREAPALELAALYHQRWQVEAVFDELKTHLRQQRRVLRSKTRIWCARSSTAGC